MPVIDLSAPAPPSPRRTTNPRLVAALAVLGLGCLSGEPVNPPQLAPEVRCESWQESIAGEVGPATASVGGASPGATARVRVVAVVDGQTKCVVSVQRWREPLEVQPGDHGLVAIVKMDGERERGRWTVLGSGKPLGGELVRWDGDDLDAGLSRVMAKLRERVPGLLTELRPGG